ncbi:alkylated DNA repair protein alkB homolog 8 isoform X2 [Poecilia reticulata]|uniref:alkylated DNA repair protein alkB homolog 8 isoform X2 n=1 Tax=Poecilia reticulata TaxID=8081 RepID=UPI0004A36F1A|nr:PREDICTED: alkylated DNA repair protein alkB homolog 8 isoform X2 [Poecilia reticulata]
MDCTVVNNVKAATRRGKEDKKVLRKQLKASHTLLKHEGISTASQPTKNLVVANGGLGNGVSREDLSASMKQFGDVESLFMPPQKPYAFVTYRSEDDARKAHTQLNGQKLLSGENSVTLYLSYVDSVKHKEEARVHFPEGLALVKDFVSPEEEALLLAAVDWSTSDQGLPEECLAVLHRCLQDGHINVLPDQLTVNQYETGQGIPPHVDTHSAFADTILSLSLGAKTVMEFRHPDGRVVPIVLPERSLLVMKGQSRYLWTHGITPRKFDLVPACETQSADHSEPDLGSHGDLTLSKRGTRTSFTFRKIRHEPCCCAFPSACDSQGGSSPSPPSQPSLPSCHANATRLEEEYVHRVYDAIASHFSSTRHTPWPRVCHFLSSLPPGSVLADVGCGNGKYLGVNPQLIPVGCDRSSALVQICTERGFNAFVSDALSVPLRTDSCDACISIAVIHHFSTQERRLAAVRELLRLLKPGGQALIYVWAYEQEYNKQRSKYLKDHNKPQNGEKSKDKLGESQEPHEEPSVLTASHLDNNHTGDLKDDSKMTEGKLSVHTNRTAFTSQDLLVPWHLKGRKTRVEEESSSGLHTTKSSDSKLSPSVDTSQVPGGSSVPVFHRYYHVFQQGELEQLCIEVTGVKVQTSYHDQGNWCVILQKE